LIDVDQMKIDIILSLID